MKDSIEVLTNLEAVGDMVGALVGMSEGLDDQAYMDGIIKAAHGRAATAFDAAAAATAKTGRIAHVYEYGVMGITKGMPKFADPTDLQARLYVHTLTGAGGNQDIGYTFRPAKQPNPKPTTLSTGVSSIYLNKLSNRKYYFYNKAFVMETGMTVQIKPDRGNFLFVPFYGEPSMDTANNRGYMMWDARRKGEITARPGQQSEDSFTKFWLAWWTAAGSSIMSDVMEEYVTIDTEAAMAEATKRANAESMKTTRETSLTSAASSTMAWVNRMFKARSAKRRETKTR